MKFTLPLLTVVLLATNAAAAPIPVYGRRSSDITPDNVLVSGPTIDAQGNAHEGTISKSKKTAVVGASNALTGDQGQVVNARSYLPFHGDRTRTAAPRPRSASSTEDAYVMYERRGFYGVQPRGVSVVGSKVNADGSVEEGKIVDNGLDHDEVIGGKNEVQENAAAGAPVPGQYRRGTSVIGAKVHADGTVEEGKIVENGSDEDKVIGSKNEVQENAAASPAPSQYRRGTSVVGPKVHTDGTIEEGKVVDNGLDHDEVVGAEDSVASPYRRGTSVVGPKVHTDGTIEEGKVVDNGLDHDEVVGAEDSVASPYRRSTSVIGPKVHADGTVEDGKVVENDLNHDEVIGSEDEVAARRASSQLNNSRSQQRRGTLVKGPVIDADGTEHEGKVEQIDGPDRVEGAEDHRTGPTDTSTLAATNGTDASNATTTATAAVDDTEDDSKTNVHVGNHDKTLSHSSTVNVGGANVNKGEDAGESTLVAPHRRYRL